MRTQYAMELESVRQNLVHMGETTVSLLSEAPRAVADPNPVTLEKPAISNPRPITNTGRSTISVLA